MGLVTGSAARRPLLFRGRRPWMPRSAWSTMRGYDRPASMNLSDSESLTPPTVSPPASAQPTANGQAEQKGPLRSAILSARPSQAILERIARHQDAGAILILAVLAVVVCGPHVLNGGLMTDDWTVRAQAHFTGFGGTLNELVGQDVRRPVGALYLATVYTLLGSHVKLLLILSITMRFLLAPRSTRSARASLLSTCCRLQLLG